MRAFKAYTSRGTYIVDDVTGLINAIGVIIRKFNNEVEIYKLKEIDVFGDEDDEDDNSDVDEYI